MAYDGRLLHQASQKYTEDRALRETRFRERQERIFARQPRLRTIEAELRQTMSRIISGALRRGTDPRPAIEVLRSENLSLQEERAALLKQMGLPADALEEKPLCPLCGDTGYRGGVVCRCLRQYYAREQQKELSRMLDLGSQSFDSFRTEHFSDAYIPGKGKTYRAHMESVYDDCVEYGHHFGKNGGNLLLFGAPGLGKTHLSAAIAREVSESGYSVVYDTATHVFDAFEAKKFGREESGGDVERILNCDLLILDDLGTELTTAFVQSALYQIVNTRLMEKRATIISTNLLPDALEQRYTPQVASRMLGEYKKLAFLGQDYRKPENRK